MPDATPERDEIFEDALAGLRRGDFSRLAPLFEPSSSEPAQIVNWLREGRFHGLPDMVAEAFTCACFLGSTAVAKFFLANGVDPAGGSATGLNALHWAANRGQVEVVRLLLAERPPLEWRNMYGGTTLGIAAWSAIHEPRSGHVAIVEALLEAGADVHAVEYPTGDDRIDGLLQRYGAGRARG